MQNLSEKPRKKKRSEKKIQQHLTPKSKRKAKRFLHVHNWPSVLIGNQSKKGSKMIFTCLRRSPMFS